MNLYFLSLINKDKFPRRKNKCCFHQLEPDVSIENVEYLKNRLKLEDGDIVMVGIEEYEFSGGRLWYISHFFVDDRKFHPLFWSQIESSLYHFPWPILDRIFGSKVKKDKVGNFIFSKVKIGKSRYNVRFKAGTINSHWTIDEFFKKIKPIPPFQLEFWSDNFEVVCYL